MSFVTGKNPFRVGLATIAAGLVLGLITLFISVYPFGAKTYTATFAQSANLRKSEDVQVAGVRVGEVREVAIVGQAVRVTFTVNKDVHLGPDTTADIKVATLLGTHFLAVTPHGSGVLPDNAIPLANTTVPFNLQDALNVGVDKVEKLDGKALAKMFGTVADELTPSNDQIEPALNGVIRVSELVVNRGDDLGELMKAARSVSTQLSASSDDLIGLMRQSNLVLSEVTARRDAIHTLLVEATRLSRNLTAVIQDTQDDVGPALKSLNGALEELRKQDKKLREVIRVMGPSVRYLANATGAAPYADLYLPSPSLPANDAQCKLGNC